MPADVRDGRLAALDQRYVGTISGDSNRIEGSWQTPYDGGQSWEVDFPLSCTRVGNEPDGSSLIRFLRSGYLGR